MDDKSCGFYQLDIENINNHYKSTDDTPVTIPIAIHLTSYRSLPRSCGAAIITDWPDPVAPST